MGSPRSDSWVRTCARRFLWISFCASMASCGSGGGGGKQSKPLSDSPTDPSSANDSLALLLDVDEIQPALDVVAVEGQSVRFSVRLGPSHNPENVTYTWSLDDATLPGDGPELQVSTQGLKPGIHVVTVTVNQDEETGRIAWRLQVAEAGSVKNRAPAILMSLPPSGRAVPRGEEISLFVLAGDVDAADALTFRWSLDGKALENAKEPLLQLDTSSLESGRHVVLVEVRDGVSRPRGELTNFSWELEVTDRGDYSPPYFSGAWPLGNARIGEAGSLRFEVDAIVPNGEDLVRYRWEVDGVLQSTDGPVLHLEPSTAEGGSSAGALRVTCRLVSGHEEAGEVGASVGWTVERRDISPNLRSGSGGANSLPVIDVVSPESVLSLEPGESRGLRVEVNDPDGDVLSYQWFVNGVRQPLDGPVFTATRGLDGTNQPLHVEVRVSDGRAPGVGSPSAELAFASSIWDLSLEPDHTLALTLSPGALIIDNGGSGTSSTGDWTKSNAAGAHGADSLYSRSLNSTYLYTFNVPQAGRYEVLLWWTAWESRSTSVPITIQHAKGTAKVMVNQRAGGGRWNSLGTYDFSSSGKVTISSSAGTLSTCADAACLNPEPSTVPHALANPGELLVDDGASGTSSVGIWLPSSATGGYNGRSLYAKTSGSYTWMRSISAPTSFDVYARWTEWSSRTPLAPYVIEHSNGTSTVTVDQRANGGKWNLLGRYSFDALVKVTLKVTGTATYCADALRLVPSGAVIPPDNGDNATAGDIIVDNGGPGTSADGAWSNSSAPNNYGGTSLYARDRGAYVYDVKLPGPGIYGLYAWYTEWSSRESSVPYEIQHATGRSVVHLDQRTNGGRWNSLGDFTLGPTVRITVRVVDANSVCADAIRLVPGGGAPVPSDSPVAPPPPPGTGSKITELAAFPLTSSLARVSWKTSFLGSSIVSFGTTTSASEITRTVTGSRWDHSVLLEPLQADKLYYVKVRSEGSSSSASSEVVSFRTPDPAPSYTVSTVHPRIFFKQADIPTLRSRIQNEPYATWWDKLLVFCNQQMGNSISEIRSGFPRTVIALAFAGLIGDVAAYRDRAIDVAMSIAGLSSPADNKEARERIDFVLPVYDWLHAYLSASEKSTLRTRLASFASLLESQVVDNEYADGHSNGNQNGAFLAALAIHGEDSSAAGIISRALSRYNEGFWPFWREHCSESGGSFKSGWYTSVATQFNYEVFAAWKSATGKDLFQAEKVWFERLADWYLHSLRGDMSWDRHGDVVFQLGVDEVERHLLQLIAREYKNTDAQWLAEKIIDFLPVYGPDMVFDILWHDSSIAAKTPTQALSRHFKGSGMVFMRESWNDESVHAMFRAVPYYMGGHSHLDQCSFAIFYKEGLALDSGLYDDYSSTHHLSYYSRTIAHNAILVTDPAEVFKLYGNTQVADGGQYWLDPARVPHPFPEEIHDLTHDDAFDLGGVKTYEDTSAFTYALGDGTLAYRPTKMATYFRHFLWIKSLPGWSHPVIAVFDEIEATRSTHKKTYLLHTANKPAVSGSLINAASGSGRLYQRTVFPQTPSIVLVGGSGKEYWVKDRNYAPNRGPKSGEEPGAWRVEISPTADRLHDEFLHILYPTDSTAAAPPGVRAIDAASMKGFESQGLVVLFASKLESVATVSYTLSASRRNLLFGLSPLRSHDVYLDGAKQSTLTSSASGTLDFTNSGAGKVELVRK